ncbi:hypothetical protein B0H66DRAFT_600791 [Apodospora peruviana]|uniref:Uncharacterized protein n=1 Tax=Apodospora peruviana TaxID=516989 RepID=A0AAE0IKM4_9PEZI|nr:hypothetical protein B0H66DRAFT_600791 [Apodospora peruviana]
MVGQAYEMLDFASRTMHPFQQLTVARSENIDAMVFDPVDQLTALLFIFRNGLRFPHGTHDEFAFPEITLPVTTPAYDDNSPRAVHVRIPAARGQLNCTVWDEINRFSDLTWESSNYELSPWEQVTLSDQPRLYRAAPSPPPWGVCLRVVTPPAVNYMYSKKKMVFFSNDSGTVEGWCGFAVRSMWLDPTSSPAGLLEPTDEHSMEQLTFLHCMPYVEALRVDATFEQPSLRVPEQSWPQPVPGTARPWNADPMIDRSIPLLQDTLLLLVALCAVLAIVLEDKKTRNKMILPSDPGNIAARIGLLAGSNIVEQLRQQHQDDNRGTVDLLAGRTLTETKSLPIQAQSDPRPVTKVEWTYRIDVLELSSEDHRLTFLHSLDDIGDLDDRREEEVTARAEDSFC